MIETLPNGQHKTNLKELMRTNEFKKHIDGMEQIVHACDPPMERTWSKVSKEYSEKWSEKLAEIHRLRSRKDLAGVVYDVIGSDVLRKSYDDITNMVWRRAREKDVDAIIELGSGWGVNLANVYLRGQMKGMPFWGLELTSAGRACTEELRRIDPAFQCLATHYDFNEPERTYEDLWKYDRVLVLTCHSIEQIPFITQEVFTGLIERMGKVHAMHFEPVGWQWDWADGGDLVRRHFHYAKKNDYNRNLMNVLRALECNGRLKIKHTKRDVSVVNPDNPTMLVEWESR
jgi:hypothetical protein